MTEEDFMDKFVERFGTNLTDAEKICFKESILSSKHKLDICKREYESSCYINPYDYAAPKYSIILS